MAPFIYRCPTTGMNVQGWFADDVSADEDIYETVTCLACRQAHLINRSTGAGERTGFLASAFGHDRYRTGRLLHRSQRRPDRAPRKTRGNLMNRGNSQAATGSYLL
jgi:hypothetical protein